MPLQRICLALLSLSAPLLAQENVLLLIGDDMGVERVAAYGEHPDPGHTPNLDRLAERGVLFRNAWSTPYCSPTRATMLTGRHPFRTGVGGVIQPLSGYALPASEITLPELLRDGTGGAYTCIALGKWHLAGNAAGAASHPMLSGFDAHAGSLHNIQSYDQWPKSINGSVGTSTTYATTDTTDDAIRAVRSLPEPWLAWVAFNAPHKPHHAPPDSLHSYNLSGNPDDTPVEHVKAMIEAMDTEIGRLLTSLDPAIRSRTTIIFVGDNGTYWPAIDGPFDPSHGKGSCYEGGVNVPLIVAGPQVANPGSESAALVHTVDIYSTVAELAGFDPRRVLPPGHALDSRSLLPYLHDPSTPSLRHVLYTERFLPNGSDTPQARVRAVREARYKLIRRDLLSGPGGSMTIEEELYDLLDDPLENRNLLLGTPGMDVRRTLLRLRARLLAP
jgi:arylsulfatase B